MSVGRADIEIEASPGAVWEMAGRFGGVDEWMPNVDSCVVVGDERHVGVGDLMVTERLLAKDDARRTLTYSLVAGMPIGHHQATITVSPIGDVGAAAHVSWTVEVSTDDVRDMLVAHYRSSLEALKSVIET